MRERQLRRAIRQVRRFGRVSLRLRLSAVAAPGRLVSWAANTDRQSPRRSVSL